MDATDSERTLSRRASRFALLAVLIQAMGCSGTPTETDEGAELAAREGNPCEALSAGLAASLEGPTRTRYLATLQARCVAAACADYAAAIARNDSDAVVGASTIVVRVASTTPSPEITPVVLSEPCASAVLLDRGRRELRNAEGALAAHPPRWDVAAAAVAAVPELPLEVMTFLGDTSVVERVRRGAYDDAVEEAQRTADAADWRATLNALTRARSYEALLRGESRPPPDITVHAGALAHRAAACVAADAATSSELPEDVGARLTEALAEFDQIAAGEVRLSSSERSRLSSAVAAAARESARCERQVELNDRCTERCAEVGGYRGDSWFERCLDYCDGRAPLCADQRDRWVASGRARSGVDVPVPALCRAGNGGLRPHPPGASAPSGRRRSGPATREEVSHADFE